MSEYPKKTNHSIITSTLIENLNINKRAGLLSLCQAEITINLTIKQLHVVLKTLYDCKEIILLKITPTEATDLHRHAGLIELKSKLDDLERFVDSAEVSGKKTIVSTPYKCCDNDKPCDIMIFPLTRGVHLTEKPYCYDVNSQNTILYPVKVGIKDLDLLTLYIQLQQYVKKCRPVSCCPDTCSKDLKSYKSRYEKDDTCDSELASRCGSRSYEQESCESLSKKCRKSSSCRSKKSSKSCKTTISLKSLCSNKSCQSSTSVCSKSSKASSQDCEDNCEIESCEEKSKSKPYPLDKVDNYSNGKIIYETYSRINRDCKNEKLCSKTNDIDNDVSCCNVPVTVSSKEACDRLKYTKCTYIWKEKLEIATEKIASHIDELNQKLYTLKNLKEYIEEDYKEKIKLYECFDFNSNN